MTAVKASPTISTSASRTADGVVGSVADADRHGHAVRRLQPDRHDHLHAVRTGGTTAVDTETVPVSGNGTYTTPTGYTLPTTAR